MNKQMSSTLAKGDNTPVVRITSVELVELINTFRKEEGNETEKEHSDLMKSIRKEIETLENAGIKDGGNFSLISYQDTYGRDKPCYSMNRAGALQMLNKESAVVRFKTTQYIDALEQKVKQPRRLTPQEELRLHYQVLEEQAKEIESVREEVTGVREEVTDLKDNMPLFNVECKELQALVRSKGVQVLGGYKSTAYNDHSLRGKVYSDIQRQLKREFGISKYEAIKRSQLDIARSIVEEYKAPTVLVTEISNLNNQMRLA
ncbi:MAG: ORF6C domain-containing protein [Zhenhengia sp.]|uniref:ORF6C domain-containing protein n=1 Tax=Zhenhengia sp. TaxID=2944208 RepID=UPI003991DBA5